MERTKRRTCLVAFAIIVAGATHLARAAAAAPPPPPPQCSDEQRTYSEGWIDGYCAAKGFNGGFVTGCEVNPDGSLHIQGYCTM